MPKKITKKTISNNAQQLSFFNDEVSHRMIIVEGMDNTGKTTLIQRLIRESGRGKLAAMVSLGPNQPTLKQFHWIDKQIKDSCLGNQLMVYDRFLPICDAVYGPILRKGSLWSNNHLILLELLEKANPLIIYARPHKDSVITGFSDGREQMDGVIENAQFLLKAYDNIMVDLDKKGFNIITYNYLKNEDTKDSRLDIKDMPGLNFNGVSDIVKEVIKNY